MASFAPSAKKTAIEGDVASVDSDEAQLVS